MVIHKRTRLTPIQREEIYRAYHEEKKKVSELAESYHVSRPTSINVTLSFPSHWSFQYIWKKGTGYFSAIIKWDDFLRAIMP